MRSRARRTRIARSDSASTGRAGGRARSRLRGQRRRRGERAEARRERERPRARTTRLWRSGPRDWGVSSSATGAGRWCPARPCERDVGPPGETREAACGAERSRARAPAQRRRSPHARESRERRPPFSPPGRRRALRGRGRGTRARRASAAPGGPRRPHGPRTAAARRFAHRSRQARAAPSRSLAERGSSGPSSRAGCGLSPCEGRAGTSSTASTRRRSPGLAPALRRRARGRARGLARRRSRSQGGGSRG